MKHPEDTLQKSCIKWFKLQYAKYALRCWHPANGGSRNSIEAAKLKAMGVLPGVCDIIITVPNKEYHGLMIELKSGKNTLSEHQEQFIKAHEKDYSCHVCYSLNEFMNVVNNYLSH